jgi:hypothetical protein
MMEDMPEKIGGFSEDVTGENVYFGPGFAISVTATQDVEIERGGALAISAGGEAEIEYGGALAINAGGNLELENGGAAIINIGRDAEITNGGAWIINAGRNVSFKTGGAIVAISGQSTVENGSVGILLSSNAQLGEGTRVLLNTPQAVALGVAAGATFALLRWLLRR